MIFNKLTLVNIFLSCIALQVNKNCKNSDIFVNFKRDLKILKSLVLKFNHKKLNFLSLFHYLNNLNELNYIYK